MKKPAFGILCALVLTTGPAMAKPGYADLNRTLTDQVVIPAYQHMARAMKGLQDRTDAFCLTPGPQSLEQAQNAFHTAMDAWQRAQPITFGPVSWRGRASRIQFWPDRNGVAERQVRKALQAQDPALIAAGGIDGKSAALQNLTTYELLMFAGSRKDGEPPSLADNYACAFAAQIARYQHRLANDILDDWTRPGGFRDAVLTAAGGNAYYNGAGQPAADFLKSLIGTFDAAIRYKLERPLGKDATNAKAKRAEGWRSERSLNNIVANLETARALYEISGGFGDLLHAAGAEAFDTGLRNDIAAAIAAARAIDLPLHAAVGQADARLRVLTLLERLRGLRVLLSGPLANEIGLVVGFNAMDGD